MAELYQGKFSGEEIDLAINGINATAEHSNSNLSISVPDGISAFTFIAPTDFSSDDTYTVNDNVVTLIDLNGGVINNGWKQGAPVSLIIQESKIYFSAGVGGIGLQIPDNLPSLMPNLHAMRLNDTQVEIYFNKVKDTENPDLQGAVIVYNIDSSVFPQSPTDGIAISFARSDLVYSGDITPIPQVVRKITVSTSTNNVKVRQYTYNSKQQYNTQLIGATASTDDLPEYDPILANNTPAQIDAIARSGRASEIWNIGDSIDITFESPISQTITFEILDFGHDPLVEGTGNAGITFGMRHLGDISGSENLFWQPIKSSVYITSNFATTLNSTIYNCIPAEWREIIKPVYKKCASTYSFDPHYGSSAIYQGSVQNYQAKLFLFSQKELTGNTYRSIDDGEQYPRFTEVGNYSKRVGNGTGGTNAWWLRTPAEHVSSSNTDARSAVVSNIGAVSAKFSDDFCAVCFGFCV